MRVPGGRNGVRRGHPQDTEAGRGPRHAGKTAGVVQSRQVGILGPWVSISASPERPQGELSDSRKEKAMQKITPFLWFDHQAEEAANFYVSVFKNSRITSVSYYGEEAAKAAGRPKGSVM